MVGIGFPKSKQQFVDFRRSGSNLPGAGDGGNTDIGKVGTPTADRHFFSGHLAISNQPLVCFIMSET